MSTGPYRSLSTRAGAAAVPAFLRMPGATGLAFTRALYELALSVPAFAGAWWAVTTGPGAVWGLPFAGAFVGLLVHAMVSRRVGDRAARDRVYEAFRREGGERARGLAEEALATFARRSWLLHRGEWACALVGYAGICLTLGDFERVLAVGSLLPPEWRRRPAFALAAAFVGDAQLFRESMHLPEHVRAYPWQVVDVAGRLAGFTSMLPHDDGWWVAWEAELDREHREHLTHVTRRLAVAVDDGWPAFLDPWHALLLEQSLRWLDRAGPSRGWPEARELLRRQRVRLVAPPA